MPGLGGRMRRHLGDHEMAKYLLAYQGGAMPETQEEQARVMAAWGRWYEGLGAAVVDPGSPVGAARTDLARLLARGAVAPPRDSLGAARMAGSLSPSRRRNTSIRPLTNRSELDYVCKREEPMPGSMQGDEASASGRVAAAPALAEDVSCGLAEAQLPAVFAFLARLAEAIVATVGPDCEVVVHDLRKPDHSIVAISGQLTGRHVGAPVPDPELLPGEVDKFTHDDLRRRGSTAGGRELLASTVWIRNPAGHIVGAVCINLDVAGLRAARDLIDRRLGQDQVSARPFPTFASNLPEFTRLAVGSVLGTGRADRHRLRAADRIELVRRLDAEGVFSLRGAANAVAAELGISRATIYADLRASRRQIPHVDSELSALPAPPAATRRRPGSAHLADPASRRAGSG